MNTEFFLNLFVDFGKKIVIDKVIKEQIFTNINSNIEFLAGNKQNNDFFNQQIVNVFSKENVRKKLKHLDFKNGFKIIDELKKFMYNEFKIIDIDINYKELFIQRFLMSFISFLKSDHKDIYKEFITEEIYNLNIELCERLNDLNEKINEIKSDNDKDIFIDSIYDIEDSLKKNTLPSIDLDFFKTDDKELSKYIEKCKFLNDNMHIICSTQEEGLYVILSELKSSYEYNVLVVNSSESWIKLKKKGIKNLILIPNFSSDNIEPISECINIFIYNEKSYCPNKDTFKIKRRKKRTLISRLEKYTKSYLEAETLINKTHGFFVPLMQMIYQGKRSDEYEIDRSDIIIIAKTLLIQKWTDNEGDIGFIEEFMNISYKEFMNIVYKYSSNENPIFIKVNGWSEYRYEITSPEKAFFEVFHSLNSDEILSIKNTFYEKIRKILKVENAQLSISLDNTLEAQIKGIHPRYSDTLKAGIYETLGILISINIKILDETSVADLMEEILDETNNVVKCADLSNYIDTIVDISPEKVIDYFYSELDDDNKPLLELFKLKTDYLLGTKYFYRYLWALEHLLVQSNYVHEAIDILFLLYSKEISGEAHDAVKKVLDYIFCSWINISSLNHREKPILLSNYCKKYQNAYSIAMDNLPYNNGYVTSIAYPKYRMPDEINEKVDVLDIQDCYKEYLNIVLAYDTSFKDFLNIYESVTKYDSKTIMFTLEKLYDKSIHFDDLKKSKIQYKISSIIHDHRFHKTAYWALKEELLVIYEKFLNKIEFSEKEYEYLYIFDNPKHNFPLLNPIPYNDDNSSNVISLNDQLVDKFISSKIEEFNNNKLSLNRLIQISSDESILGAFINQFTGKTFSKKVVDEIINTQRSYIILDKYYRYICYNDPNIYLEAIKYLISLKYDDKQIACMMSYYNINDELMDFIDECTPNILNEFWKIRHYSIGKIKLENISKALDNIVKYGNFGTYIEFIYAIKSYVEIDYIYQTLIKYEIKDFSNIDAVYDKYLLEQVLNYVYPYCDEEEKINNMASFELKHWFMIEWNKMKFLPQIIKKDSRFYSELIIDIFGNNNASNTYNKSKLFHFYINIKFCPGEENGKINERVFTNWIETFKEIMLSANLESKINHILGKLFAYSPGGNDGYPLEEVVRQYIENNYTKEMMSSYVCEIINKRGVFNCTQGEEENKIALQYMDISEFYRKNKYKKCSKIYNILSNEFKRQAIIEEESALYE